MRIDSGQAWDIVKESGSIVVAKGKKVTTFNSIAADQEGVLKAVMGPSGNLRAPTFRIGDKYIVGFNLEMYAEKLK